MSLFRQGRLAGLLAALVMVLAACGGGGDEGGQAAATADGIKLVKEGKLTVCTHLPYEPFQFQDDSGKVVGFDVDLLDLLAKDLGVEIEVLDIEWEQITSGAVFAANRCDMGMGAMTITEERAAALTITDPYFDATQALAVKADSGFKTLADLKGKRVGVQTGTTGQNYGEEHADEFGYTTQVFDDSALQLNALKAGNIDAAINDNAPILTFVADNPDIALVEEFDTGEQYGFAAKKDDPNAQKMVDRWNELFAEAKSDGTYDEIFQKWFKAKPSE